MTKKKKHPDENHKLIHVRNKKRQDWSFLVQLSIFFISYSSFSFLETVLFLLLFILLGSRWPTFVLFLGGSAEGSPWIWFIILCPFHPSIFFHSVDLVSPILPSWSREDYYVLNFKIFSNNVCPLELTPSIDLNVLISAALIMFFVFVVSDRVSISYFLPLLCICGLNYRPTCTCFSIWGRSYSQIFSRHYSLLVVNF